MPLSDDIAVPTDTWEPVTDGPVTLARLQNVGDHVVMIQATSGSTPPASGRGSLRLAAGLIGDVVEVASRFASVGSSARLWARAVGGDSIISADHG